MVRRAIFLILCLLLLTGCWNRREIETLGFVSVVGLDRAPEDDKIMVTVHVDKPFSVASSEGGGVQLEKGFWVVSSTGHTVFEAIRNFTSQTPRRLSFFHNQFIIFGEELAREGVKDVLDFFDRDGEPRRLAQLMIGKDARATEILQLESEMEILPTAAFSGILRNTTRGQSSVVTTKLHDFLIRLHTEGIEPVATRIEMIPKKAVPLDLTGEVLRLEVTHSPRITGAAVFKGDRLVGWLDQKETRGLNWVTGDVEGGIIVVEHPSLPNDKISLEVLRVSGSFEPQVQGDRVTVLVELKVEGNLGDSQGLLQDSLKQDQDLWGQLEKAMASAIHNEIMESVTTLQNLNSDAFGFGAALFRNNPEEWKRLGKRWDEIFPLIDVQTDIVTKLRRPGIITRTSRKS
ncbi:MAG: Ger(x)C family spore germination protein [Limnochordia bacterium]|jgi:spore germination protein KC